MNTDTGHLKLINDKEDIPPGYELVPEHLRAEAMRALGHQSETTVDLDSDSELARWAASERRKRRNKKIRSYREFCR